MSIRSYYGSELRDVRWNNTGQGKATCPFHDDDTPSLSIDAATGKFFCHGCNAHGGIVAFHMRRHDLEHDEARRRLARLGLLQQSVASTYDYLDESGNLIFQVVRYEPKRFSQRRPDGRGGWINNLDGVTRMLYRLPEVIEADQVFIVEGEKDVETLRGTGLVATCNPMGAGKWRSEYNEYLRGKSVIIIPDNDEPGKAHAQSVAGNLAGIAASIKVLELTGLRQGGDITDWFENGGNKPTLIRLVLKTDEWSHERVIDVTVDAENTAMPICAFPMHVFPTRFRQFVEDAATALHVEPQLVAFVALAIMSGAIGNSTAVSPRPGYTVNLFLWGIVIAESGSGKTPVMSTLMRHIERLQAQEHLAYDQQITGYRLAQNNDEAATPERPTLTHLFVSDCTVESLSTVYENNKRGIIIHTDEIARLILGLDQYHGRGNDRQHYVELFNGGSWKIDRKSGGRMITNTGAAIIGGIQPNRMPDVFKENSFDDGLLPRFLLYRADNSVRSFNREGMSADTLAYWELLIDQCYALPLDIDNEYFARPKILTFSEDALNVYMEYYNRHAEIAPFRTVRQRIFMQKLISYHSLKFAGLLHVMRGLYRSNRSIIQVDTVQKALALTDFFAGQVTKMLRLYAKETQHLDEFERRLIVSLRDLQNAVANGRIPLSAVHERFNDQLPEGLKMTPEKVASMLKKFGLRTEKGAHNRSRLVWEVDKIERLFSHPALTSVTTVTQDSTVTPDGQKDRYVSTKVITTPRRAAIVRRRRKAVNDETT